MEETTNVQNHTVQNVNVLKTKDELLNALKQNFATTVNKVFINSKNQEFGFREVTVLEQKTLSRIMLNNNTRKDVIYDTQCALMNKIALDPDFDIYNMSEFDKIKLLMVIYQGSIFKKDVEFTCKACGSKNSYRLDFDSVISKLDKMDISDREFTYQDRNFKYDFVIGYPTVGRISQFYKQYVRRNVTPGMTDKQVEEFDNNSNMEYINQYIRKLQMTDMKTGKVQQLINFDQYSPCDVGDILQVFPQDLVYNEDGVVKFITDEFVKKINDQFEQHKCQQCGEVHNDGINGVNGFL